MSLPPGFGAARAAKPSASTQPESSRKRVRPNKEPKRVPADVPAAVKSALEEFDFEDPEDVKRWRAERRACFPRLDNSQQKRSSPPQPQSWRPLPKKSDNASLSELLCSSERDAEVYKMLHIGDLALKRYLASEGR